MQRFPKIKEEAVIIVAEDCDKPGEFLMALITEVRENSAAVVVAKNFDSRAEVLKFIASEIELDKILSIEFKVDFDLTKYL